jgi:hypothetical protein
MYNIKVCKIAAVFTIMSTLWLRQCRNIPGKNHKSLFKMLLYVYKHLMSLLSTQKDQVPLWHVLVCPVQEGFLLCENHNTAVKRLL